jgi:hypothetical protein
MNGISDFNSVLVFLGMKIVWIVESSLIQSAFEHTNNRQAGANLGLEKYGVQLVWVGMRGMKWENVTDLRSV